MENYKRILVFLAGVLLLAGLWWIKHPVTTGPETSSENGRAENQPQTNLENKTNTTTENQTVTSKLSAQDQKTIATVEEIIKSRNDNDPRVDTELKNLTTAAHENLYQVYKTLPAENRNGRGLVVFLIARDLKSKDDIEFLRKIYEEPPCLSMENCGQAGNEDPHLTAVNESSLNYPQLTALYQIDKKITSDPEGIKDPETREGLKTILQEAANFSVPSIQQRADQIKQKL